MESCSACSHNHSFPETADGIIAGLVTLTHFVSFAAHIAASLLFTVQHKIFVHGLVLNKGSESPSSITICDGVICTHYLLLVPIDTKIP